MFHYLEHKLDDSICVEGQDGAGMQYILVTVDRKDTGTWFYGALEVALPMHQNQIHTKAFTTSSLLAS